MNAPARAKTRIRLSRAVLVALGLAIPALPARATDDPAADAQRWHDVQHAMFGTRQIHDGTALLKLDAPPRAEDASLVPMTITTAHPDTIRGLYLIIDNNPSPLAAHFTFGPAADPSEIRLRVRVDQYTNVHAVAETKDGTLYATTQFVKAAGGCSAPAGATEADALRGIGQMKLRELTGTTTNKPIQVQLLLRHPNFNGMQMNQLTRLYTLPRFIDSVDVRTGTIPIFHLDSDISLSTDPAITFAFTPVPHTELHVTAHDSANAVFEKSFDVPAQGS